MSDNCPKMPDWIEIVSLRRQLAQAEETRRNDVAAAHQSGYEEGAMDLAAMKERAEKAEADNARLQATVDKLPKTKDGALVVPGETYWAVIKEEPDGESRVSTCRYIGHASPWVEYDWEVDDAIDNILYDCDVYSTREAAEGEAAKAAEAAREKENDDE